MNMFRIISKAVLLTFFLFCTFVPFALKTDAAVILDPLGGIQTQVQYCDEGLLVYNLDFITNTVIPIGYVPGVSILYANYGVYKSGSYNVTQYIPSGFECTIDGETVGIGIGVWYQLGTS
jgi:hypothetical protein